LRVPRNTFPCGSWQLWQPILDAEGFFSKPHPPDTLVERIHRALTRLPGGSTPRKRGRSAAPFLTMSPRTTSRQTAAEPTGAVVNEAFADFDLSGRTAVITGAASDMGVATALRLAAAGANVALGDIDASRVETTAARIAERGTGALSMPTDVTRSSDVTALVERAVERFGRVDVMVNLAGIIHDARVAETDEADLERVLAVNVKGVYFGCQAAVAAMGDQGSGSIVNMASLAAFAPIPQLSAYAISKAGIVALTKVLAAEVSGVGIRVNAIAPGFIEGGMTRRHSLTPAGEVDEAKMEAERARARDHIPLHITGRPEDVANATLFLASDASRYLTGQVLHPNGGSYMP
jgi:3-oxoacyl-[acyl-carrier protein] reductase